MTEGNYIPLTDEAIDDVKEYLKNVMFDHNAPDSITGIRFYHRGGFLWAGGNESLNKEEFDEGVMYRYTIKIVQSSGNE